MESIALILFREGLFLSLSSTNKQLRLHWRQSAGAKQCFQNVEARLLKSYWGYYSSQHQKAFAQLCDKFQAGVEFGFLNRNCLEQALFRVQDLLCPVSNDRWVKTSVAVDRELISRETIESKFGSEALMSCNLDYFLTVPSDPRDLQPTQQTTYFALLACVQPPFQNVTISWQRSLIAMAEFKMTESTFSRSCHWLFHALPPMDWICDLEWFRLIALNYNYLETAKSFPAHGATIDQRAINLVVHDNQFYSPEQFALLIEWYGDLIETPPMDALRTSDYLHALLDPRCQAALAHCREKAAKQANKHCWC